jgi:hypothetical protein
MNRRNRITAAFDRATRLAAAGVCLTIPMGMAHADVKITVEVTTEDGSSVRPSAASGGASADAPVQNTSDNPPAPRKVTIYYKGKMARREVAGGATTLYDGANNKVYALYPDQKTYSVVAMKDAFKVLTPLSNMANAPGQPSTTSSSLPEGMRQETQTALDKTGLTQSVVGKETQKYTLEANQRLVRDQPSGQGGGQGGGGRRGRRGGSGGGGGGGRGGDGGGGSGGQGGPSRGGMGMPSTEMEGEYWLADAGLLPESGKSPALPLLVDTVPPSSILKSLNDKMTKLKLIPLSSKVTLRTSAFNGSSIGSSGSSRALIVVTTQVTSITEVSLDDALFQPPADYQKVAPEAAARQNHVAHDVDGQ